ncbi:prolipoprotein diacylglyceryl transferase [Mycobacterium gordonae]|nr:prolipoprotein diacylglyceryl transferase [Mycobacterium gordonae]OBK56419.1 prolipoprotein diacylglyceryl transferase [Mycobacterium gordonae]
MTVSYLAYIPSPPRGVWHLGPLPIRAYAFFIITGILVALLIADRRWAARGGQRGVVYDIALWMVPFGLIGGRLYHLATDWQTYWGPGGAGMAAALRIWDGGLGIWGAVALGAVGAWIGCRRRGIPLPAFLDAVAPGVVLAQAIGRLGNYFNQELYGRETTMPWGLEIFYRRDPAGYVDVHSLDGVSTGQVALVVQPTFLYELLWNLLVFGILLLLDRRFSLGHARLFASYVALYCVGRFAVELLRDDTATHIAGIRINTFTSTFVFIAAVVYIILAPKGREDPALLRGHVGDDEVLEPEPDEELAAVGAASGATAAAAATAASGADEAEPEDVDTETDEQSEAEVEAAQAAVADDAVEGDVSEADQADIVEAASEADEAEEAEEEAELAPVAEPAEPEDAEAEEAEGDAVDAETEVAEADEASGAGESEAAADEAVTEGVAEAEPEEAEVDEPVAKPQDVDPVEAVVDEAETEPVDATESEAQEPASPEVEDAEPAGVDAASTVQSAGHPLLGGSTAPAVAEDAEEAEDEAGEPERDEADEADEAEEAAEADEADEADEAEEVDEAAEAAEAEEADEPEEPAAEFESSESEPSEPETVDAETDAVEPDLAPPEATEETEEATSDSDEDAPPASTDSAATARQRWRLRLRRRS